jgi:hypothetical protein
VHLTYRVIKYASQHGDRNFNQKVTSLNLNPKRFVFFISDYRDNLMDKAFQSSREFQLKSFSNGRRPDTL